MIVIVTYRPTKQIRSPKKQIFLDLKKGALCAGEKSRFKVVMHDLI